MIGWLDENMDEMKAGFEVLRKTEIKGIKIKRKK